MRGAQGKELAVGCCSIYSNRMFLLAEKSMFAFPMVGAILLVVFVASFLMTAKTVNGKLYDTTETKSEAAKVKMQAVKQEEI